ncbi:MAG: ornithine carbamoyltransferase [Candidatus Brocadiia bacterium]
MKLKTKHLLSINDLSGSEIMGIMKMSQSIKKAKKHPQPLKGMALGMIFQKPSTRTRVSFEVGMFQLGGHALYLSSNDIQLKRGETIPDTARTLSRYVDGIIARVFAHQDVVDLARYGSVPVINALSDYEHPCQTLADLLTIYEKRKTLKNLKITYVGDGNNVAHSLMLGAVKVGSHVAVATPKGYEPHREIVRLTIDEAKKTKVNVTVTNDPVEAAKDADVIYTDVWASMGQESEHEKRVQIFKPYQINRALLSHARKDVLVMHCLPAHRGEEITEDVLEGKHSVVWDEAENRLHTQKAVMWLLMK